MDWEKTRQNNEQEGKRMSARAKEAHAKVLDLLREKGCEVEDDDLAFIVINGTRIRFHISPQHVGSYSPLVGTRYSGKLSMSYDNPNRESYGYFHRKTRIEPKKGFPYDKIVDELITVAERTQEKHNTEERRKRYENMSKALLKDVSYKHLKGVELKATYEGAGELVYVTVKRKLTVNQANALLRALALIDDPTDDE